MFNFYKKQAYINNKREEFIKAVLNWNIEVEATYDEFRAFLDKMEDLCKFVAETKDITKIMASIPNDIEAKIHFHLGFILGRFYTNVYVQHDKVNTLIKTNKIKNNTKEYMLRLLEIVDSSIKIVEKSIKDLNELIAIK